MWLLIEVRMDGKVPLKGTAVCAADDREEIMLAHDVRANLPLPKGQMYSVYLLPVEVPDTMLA